MVIPYTFYREQMCDFSRHRTVLIFKVASPKRCKKGLLLLKYTAGNFPSVKWLC